jgi:outer membrane lipoprotein-sorting protein
MEIWIYKTSYIILKITTTTRFDSSVQEETHRDIKIDEKILNAIFEAKIPAG